MLTTCLTSLNEKTVTLLLLAILIFTNLSFGVDLIYSNNTNSNFDEQKLFYSTKVIDEMEVMVSKDPSNEKLMFLLLFMIDNPSCSNSQEIRINKLLLQVIHLQAEHFLQVYKNSPLALKARIRRSLKCNCISSKDKLNAQIAVSAVNKLSLSAEVKEINTFLIN